MTVRSGQNHTVTGENAMLLKVRTRDTQSLEYLLASH
jgi:hypothetical protein